MPRVRRSARRQRAVLTHQQEWELRLGPGGRPSSFADDQERRAAWQDHRHRFMHEVSRRPWAWWHYESGLGADYRFFGLVEQLAWLEERGLLTDQERTDLAHMRRQRAEIAALRGERER